MIRTVRPQPVCYAGRMPTRQHEPFATTCPLFGTAVTEYPSGDDSRVGGDYRILKDDEGYYCISGTVESTATSGLTHDHKARLRAWLSEQRAAGEDYPKITSDVVQRILSEPDDD